VTRAKADPPSGGPAVIRNAVIHISNEQPMQADLYDMPAPGDVSLVCTNLRTMNGSRPVFADHIDSVFIFPYAHIRFVEIAPGAKGVPALPPGQDAASGAPKPPQGAPPPQPEEEGDLELDEDLMRRIRDV
jgi:hypothetical protein